MAGISTGHYPILTIIMRLYNLSIRGITQKG